MGLLLLGAAGIRHYLGVLSCVWGHFGRLRVSLRKEGLLRDVLRLPPARHWGPGASGPCMGPRAASVFPIPSLVLVST
jgi:hypothetical protein